MPATAPCSRDCPETSRVTTTPAREGIYGRSPSHTHDWEIGTPPAIRSVGTARAQSRRFGARSHSALVTKSSMRWPGCHQLFRQPSVQPCRCCREHSLLIRLAPLKQHARRSSLFWTAQEDLREQVAPSGRSWALGLYKIFTSVERFVSHLNSKPICNKLPEPGMLPFSELADRHQKLLITRRNYSPIV